MPFVGIGAGIGRQRFAQGGIFEAYAARVAADGGVTEAGACVNAVSGISLNSSLLLVPSGYKSGVVYSQIPTNGDGDLTFTRASDATRVNSDGEIEVVGSGVPRLDYSQGSCPALLLEPQRTNLALYSSNSNTSYTLVNTTFLASQALSIGGSTTGASISETTANNNHYYGQISGISVTSGVTYTFSVFLKKGNGATAPDIIQLTFNFGGFGAVYANFNISNGTIGTVSGVTANISQAPNGFYRCSITATATSTNASTGALFGFVNNNLSSSRLPTYIGSTTSNVFYDGFQIEAGSYATSYIPTTSATVTRLADSFTRNNIYTNGLITSSGGTWVVSFVNNAEYIKDSGDRGLFLDTSNTGNTNGFQFVHRNTGGITQRILINKRISGVDTIIYQSSVATIKIAIKWNGTSADVFANGTKVVSATAFTPTAMEFLNFTSDGVPTFIQSMALFSTPLSDSDCVSLTT